MLEYEVSTLATVGAPTHGNIVTVKWWHLVNNTKIGEVELSFITYNNIIAMKFQELVNHWDEQTPHTIIFGDEPMVNVWIDNARNLFVQVSGNGVNSPGVTNKIPYNDLISNLLLEIVSKMV